jgi:hypothetical protein
MQTQANLARQSVDLTWATLAGSLDRASANRAYVESMTRESARYCREAGRLGVDCATDLVAFAKSVSTTVLRGVAASGRKLSTRPPAGVTEGAPSVRLAPSLPDQPECGRLVEGILQGPVGGRAEATIMVANLHPRPRRIQLSAGNLVDSQGALVGADLDISPTTVTVPSGQERPVSLGVNLDETSFWAGQQYSCTVDVSGGDEARIELSIEVSA